MQFEIPLPAREIFSFFLVFARVGTALMLAPAIGENWVPPRARLVLALGLASLIPAAATFPDAPESFAGAIPALTAEVAAGLVLGGLMRLFLAAPVIAGQIVSQSITLSNIFVVPGMAMETGSVLGGWLSLGTIMFIFASGLHYLIIDTVAASYQLIPPGGLNLGDAAREAVRIVGGVFALGVQMAMPFILLGFVFNLGIGLINKMMLALPIYFIAAPVAILGGLFVLAQAIGPMLVAYRNTFSSWLLHPFT